MKITFDYKKERWSILVRCGTGLREVLLWEILQCIEEQTK